jgi:hypothetical protein
MITFKATVNNDVDKGLAIINAAESLADTPFGMMWDFNSSVTMVGGEHTIFLPMIIHE